MNQPIYKDQNLQDQAFVGLDLTGADFSGSDLRGCDFTRATLIGTNFDRVVTGQTQQQISTAIFSVVMGAIAIFVIAAILGSVIVTIDNLLFGWFGEVYRVISRIFPAIILFGLYFFQGNILEWFPKTTNFFGNASIGILWLVMLFLTLGLGATSFSGGSGSFLFLIPTVISAIVTFKVFIWLIASIKSRVGTSFKKANLTEASFSHALIENTDFSFALLTGICVDGWLLDAYTLFTKSQCDYLYWKPQKDRYPHHDDFQGDELEKFLSQFTTQK